MKKAIFSVFLATIWISLSEFFRNEYLLKNYWVEHYSNMGLIFPSEPVNGAMWGIWSLFFAITIYIVSRRFNFNQTLFLSWFSGFILMWIVTGNMGVLPYEILIYAVPLSILEVLIACIIIFKISPARTQG